MGSKVILMDKFFTEAFEKMDDEARESFYKTVFLNDDSEYAAKVRNDYYKTKLKHMGENVQIGKGVKFVNPEYISLGDNVKRLVIASLIYAAPASLDTHTALAELSGKKDAPSISG